MSPVRHLNVFLDLKHPSVSRKNASLECQKSNVKSEEMKDSLLIFALSVLETIRTISAILGTRAVRLNFQLSADTDVVGHTTLGHAGHFYLRASGYHVDMHDGLLNCFLTFEKFESETFLEAISRKEYSNPCRPIMKPTVPSTTTPKTTTTTTTKSNMFMWSGWSDWERSRDKKKTHIRQRFCMNGRNFVETGLFGKLVHLELIEFKFLKVTAMLVT